ncbi:MAG TPA: ATP-binding protein [Bacteroidetes bacterium]|nr:ATP-binding protein [Bacteroidota bacterium]
MTNQLIGRKEEKKILKKALESSEAEMISVIGRRRVGKTYLIREMYKKEIVFEISGLQDATGKEQLRNFANQLKKFSHSKITIPPPKDWLDAFFMLEEYLSQAKMKKKSVIFFDEVPWLATHKSGFLKGLTWFWNSWAVQQKIVVVICGSSASWMIQKILRNKGGLHNRVTKRIRLHPFNLSETEAFLASKKIRLARFQLLQLYMAMGGIPHYLKEIEGGKSATQNIEKICFRDTGLLRDEFLNLYPALFEHSNHHVAIVRALAVKPSGMTRVDLIKKAKLKDSGRITKVLDELSESGFITAYPAFGKKKKSKLFRLTDEYSLFYLRFIENNLLEKEGIWLALSQGQSYKIWCGYAFENICLKHISQIKKALGISGVYTRASSFFKKADAISSGVQIDLLIDRNDQTINVVEIKFHTRQFTISKDYARKLREKVHVFREYSKTQKQIFLSFISVFGIKPNVNSIGLVDNDLNVDVLFEKIERT